MDNIRQALDRARTLRTGGESQQHEPVSNSPYAPFDHVAGGQSAIDGGSGGYGPEIILDRRHLEANRVIAYDDADFRSRSFDMLKTQVLQSMDQNNWRIVGITSPSSGCGKTVTAVNLAFSVARQPERAALLVDLDLQKPRVAGQLGLDCESGVISTLECRTSLPSALVTARAGNYRITVLPTETSTLSSSARMTSPEMSTLLQEIKRNYPSHTVIIDLPPMLASDDVIAILPQLDCTLLVAAVGHSTIAEIEECNKYLQTAEVLRLVLNKVPGSSARYYYSRS
jgi:protein-tyrosine kinase